QHKPVTANLDHKGNGSWNLTGSMEWHILKIEVQQLNKKCSWLQPVEINTRDRNPITEAMEEDTHSRSKQEVMLHGKTSQGDLAQAEQANGQQLTGLLKIGTIVVEMGVSKESKNTGIL
ncbi:hypothetical protein EK904_003503, partial [Melospiza melodia maxima]